MKWVLHTKYFDILICHKSFIPILQNSVKMLRKQRFSFAKPETYLLKIMNGWPPTNPHFFVNMGSLWSKIGIGLRLSDKPLGEKGVNGSKCPLSSSKMGVSIPFP